MNVLKLNRTNKQTHALYRNLKVLIVVLKGRSFWLSLAVLAFGIYLNYSSQAYLHTYIQSGKTLPVLSDLILNNLPYIDIDFVYDYLMIMALGILSIYIYRTKNFYEIPLILLTIGSFHIVRAVFIILTPFGNPPMFDGTESIFGGFSNYEIGVYPSGHTGVAFMYFLFMRGKAFRLAGAICVLGVVVTLLLARGHYSIDIFSGILFAYATKTFIEKHLYHHLNEISIRRFK